MPNQMGRVRALAQFCTLISSQIRTFRRAVVMQFLLGAGAAVAMASTEEVRNFDIPAGPAEQSLNQYAKQARVEIGFPVDEIGEIRTNPITGRYPAKVALQLLLEGTGLVANRHDGGLTVSGNSAILVPDRHGQLRDSGINVELIESGDQPDTGGHKAESRPDKSGHLLEEILVTGSRIRGATRASPMVTLTREEIDRTGYSTVGQVVESLPQNFGAGATQDSVTDRNASAAVGGSVDNIAGGQSINLRGLGTGSTLVLLNGRRMSPSGLSARFTDISRIPLSAVERVEVLTDGASAIYGSDAIGGVVNFILRDAYEGAETRLKYGSDTSGDMSEIVFSQAAGTSWSDGSVLASYEYYRRDSLANKHRRFAASADLRPFGGSDWRQLGGNPANIVAAGETIAIPPSQDGTSLTPGDFSSERVLNVHDFRAAEDLFPRQERHNFFFNLVQEFGSAEAFAQLHLARRETLHRVDQTLRSFDVTEANPYFVDPTADGLSTIRIANYSMIDDLGPRLATGESDSDGAVVGVSIDIFKSWNAEVTANWSREKSIQGAANSLNQIALQRALNSSDPASAFNPFGDGSHTPANVISGLLTDTGGYTARQELTSIELNLDGEVFRLSNDRWARLATGLEFRDESLESERRQGAEIEMPIVVPGHPSSRNIFAAYAEVFVPIIGNPNPKSEKEMLELSLAGRYEHYSDFGDTIDPKVGIVWSPTKALVLRGTYGTSFRAPALWDLDTTAPGNSIIFVAQQFVDAGSIPFTALMVRGGGEHLKPEEATTWTAGIQLSPDTAKGLSVDLTYFDIDFRNRIDLPFVSLFDAFLPRFAFLMTVNPTLEEIATYANDPRYLESVFGTTTPAADLISGTTDVGAIIDGRRNNISKSEVAGIELSAAYQRETTIGTFNFGLYGSYLLDFKRSLLATEPLLEEVDTVGRPVDFRMRANLSWLGQLWSVTGYLNYIDSYTDQRSEPNRSVSSWTTLDLTVSYDFPRDSGLFSDMRLSLSTQNLLNEDPPFVDAFGAQGYDSSNATGLGRFVTMQITKEW